MEHVIEVSIQHHGRSMTLLVPEVLHESVQLYAENRKIPQNQVYSEAVDGTGHFSEQIRKRARIKKQQI